MRLAALIEGVAVLILVGPQSSPAKLDLKLLTLGPGRASAIDLPPSCTNRNFTSQMRDEVHERAWSRARIGDSQRTLKSNALFTDRFAHQDECE